MKVLCSRWIPDDIVKAYPDFEFDYPKEYEASYSKEELAEKLKDVEAIFIVSGPKLPKEVWDKAKNLKYIASLGVGLDDFDIPYFSQRGVAICNSPTMVTDPTAEHSVAMIMAAFRNIPRYTADMKNGHYETHVWGKYQTGLTNKTLGIVGFGRIGQSVAKKCQGLGMNIIYYDIKRLPLEKEKELNVEYKDIDDLFKLADCVTVHIPYTKENDKLINKAKFDEMKDGAYFCNMARGKVCDTNALIDALKAGKLKGAALDVFDPEPYLEGELLNFDNVVLTPHVASETAEGRLAMGHESVSGIYKLVHGEIPHNFANPDCLNHR